MLSGYKPNFKLATEDAGQDDSNVIPRVGSSRLPKYCYAVADKLTDNYTRLGQLRNRLLVEQDIFERSALKESDSLEWGNRVIKTHRALQDDCQHTSIEEAVHFENHMYEVYRQNNNLDRSLFWARHLVGEYTRAGRTEAALTKQLWSNSASYYISAAAATNSSLRHDSSSSCTDAQVRLMRPRHSRLLCGIS